MITSFHLFHYAKGNHLAGLKAFVNLRQAFGKMPGASFARAMGCGRGTVFSLRPDWGRYAFLVEWESEMAMQEVLQNNPHWQRLESTASSAMHCLLQPVRGKGVWDGQHPFSEKKDEWKDAPLAVLTRATMNLWQLPSFWKHSYRTTEAISRSTGLLFSLGMGEWPLFKQATFSIWESDAAMKAFAYKDPAHLEAMKQKVKRRMFREELFVRFRVLQTVDRLAALSAG